MTDELKQIKKLYGEDMAHLCRSLFPTILNNEGVLLKILKDNLAPTRSLAQDIIDKDLYDSFKSWVYSFYRGKKQELLETDKTPFELMDEAGYKLYECHTEEEIQSFRKYYAEDEVICTIYMGGRLSRCHVFFAVKKNVDEIKREDFPNPQRDDLYGTSVISIQFARGIDNTLSIKNRYNHTVLNCDSTFGNNLENIIPGLTKSFEKYYGYHIELREEEETSFLNSRLGYVRGRDGKYYRYNLEIDGIYYCENNIIIKDGEVITKYAEEKERYILLDQMILDIKDKKIFLPFESSVIIHETFPETINSLGSIKNINIIKNGDNKTILIKYNDDKEVKIEIDRHNAIIGYENNYIENVPDNLLSSNKALKSITLNNAKKIGKSFVFRNTVLEEVSLPKVEKISNGFLRFNLALKKISLPSVIEIGRYFLYGNIGLEELEAPKLQSLDNKALGCNKRLKKLSLPELTSIGNDVLNSLESNYLEIYLPKVKSIGKDFLLNIKGVMGVLELPMVEEIDENFMKNTQFIHGIIAPKLTRVDDNFLANAVMLKIVKLPSIEILGSNCMRECKQLKTLELPSVTIIGENLLKNNTDLKYFSAPKLGIIDPGYLEKNEYIRKQIDMQMEERMESMRRR